MAQPIFDVIEGNCAGGAKVLYLSNPTQTSGEFYDSHNSKAGFYYPIHVSSRDTPNAKSGLCLIPGLALLSWCDAMLKKWGPLDPRYQVRVLGDFPSQSEAAVIPAMYLDLAEARWRLAPAEGELVFGLDVARFGDDDPVLCARRGKKVLELGALPRGDGPNLAGFARDKARLIARANGYDDEEPLLINVDEIGLGAAVFDSLKGYKDVEAVGVNVALPSSDPKEYFNVRTELYFLCREWLASGGALPVDVALRQELLAHDYDFSPATGACRLEPKEKIKKKIQRSPDRSEAFVLSLYERPNPRYTSVRKRKR